MKRWLAKFTVLILACFFAFLAMEIALQVHEARIHRCSPVAAMNEIPSHILCPEPFLYRLNPAHGEISSQGLRDREYAIPKPAGAFRILMLGDSIVYGSGFPRAELFTEIMETSTPRSADGRMLEVINAGVRGYTTYNEVMYYETEGRRFGSDVVLLCVCLNDIVNPRTHWGYTREAVTNIPADAIPNHEVDRRIVLPFMHERHHWSALVRSFSTRRFNNAVATSRYLQVDGKQWPAYLAEGTTQIDRWLSDTPEWNWFASWLLRLKKDVAADGAQLAIVVFPLSYQLQPGYPFHPGARIAEFAERERIPTLDLEPIMMSAADPQSLFLSKKNDIWHLSGGGHQATAEWIREFLVGRGFFPAL